MKNDRLFSIVYLLMNRGMMTADALARELEVSKRTIHRDVESLAMAGIPIYTQQGKHGGIALTEGFVLDRSLLSKDEQEQIVSALLGLRVTQALDDELLAKVSSLFGAPQVPWLDVDLVAWSNSRRAVFQALKAAILHRNEVCFDYYGRARQPGARQVRPMQLCFQTNSWFLRAYCLTRQDFRTFKLSRMRNLRVLDTVFDPIDEGFPVAYTSSTPQHPPAPIHLWVDASQAYRVLDEFDEDEIQMQSDGSFHITLWYYPDEWVFGMLQSFGAYIEVLSPASMREALHTRLLLAAEKNRPLPN